jgi:hypothetical protein
MPVGLESAETASQQNALELLDMGRGEGHDLKDSSSRARLLPVCKDRLRGPEDG